MKGDKHFYVQKRENIAPWGLSVDHHVKINKCGIYVLHPLGNKSLVYKLVAYMQYLPTYLYLKDLSFLNHSEKQRNVTIKKWWK